MTKRLYVTQVDGAIMIYEEDVKGINATVYDIEYENDEQEVEAIKDLIRSL